MNNKSSNVFIKLIKIGLILYTMVRSIDLVMSTLPESIKFFALAVVCGLDLALLAWDDYTANPNKARSEAQHNVGVIMIVGNMLGIGAAMVADSARIVDPAGSIGMINVVSIFVISAVVLANVGALIAVNQLDPDRAEAQAAAKHERELARLKKDHDRQMEMNDRKTELDIAAFVNMDRIKKARQRYHLGDGDNKGQTPDVVDQNRLMSLFQEALEAMQHTAVKSPNGTQTMGATGAALEIEETSPKGKKRSV